MGADKADRQSAPSRNQRFCDGDPEVYPTENAFGGDPEVYPPPILRARYLDEERERRIHADARRTFPYVSGRVNAPDKVIR